MIIKSINPKYFSNICVLVNNKSEDLRAAKVVRNLKEINPDFKFFGISGPLTKKEVGDFKEFANFDNLNLKTVFPIKNADTYTPHFWLHPPSLFDNFYHFKTIQELNKNNFYDYLINNETNLILSFSNEFLSRKILKRVSKYYSKNLKLRPPTLFFNKDQTKRRFDDIDFIDNAIYYNPIRNMNKINFNFPKTHLGSQSVFDVYKFLYEQNNYKKYYTDNSIFINNEYSQELFEELIFNINKQYREKNEIGNTDIIVFLSLGSNSEEIESASKLCAKSCSLFVDNICKKYKLSKSQILFKASILDNQIENVNKIKSIFSKSKINIDIITNREDKFKAMAASDLAACVAGESVLEFISMQLPTLVIDNMNFIDSYKSLIYNTYNSDINQLANGEIVTELVGMNFPEKLNELWLKNYENPKLKYKMMRRSEKFIYKFLSKKSDQEGLTVNNNIELNEFYNPSYLQTQCLNKFINLYSLNKNTEEIHEKELENLRRREFQNLEVF